MPHASMHECEREELSVGGVRQPLDGLEIRKDVGRGTRRFEIVVNLLVERDLVALEVSPREVGGHIALIVAETADAPIISLKALPICAG